MDIKASPKTILQIFSSTTYDIDFYQREYKWDKVPVLRLLDDVHDNFNEDYEERKKKQVYPSSAEVNEYYHFYYLNTVVTNTISDKVYVVDGQQRLTTLTLILIAMYRTIVSSTEADNSYDPESEP